MLLDAPKCPEGCEYLWSIFRELHACRGNTMNGPCAITFVDLDAFQRVTGTKLLRWELQAIKAADGAYLANWAERHPPAT